MNSQPLLSVIVPCYNVALYIDKCIASIVGQTYSNLEILLVNDGSTDQTGSLCDAWQEKDSRIRVFHKQNEGASMARKTAFENVTGEFVTFVDSDDWIAPTMYSDLMAALFSTNSDIADSDICHVPENGEKCYRYPEDKVAIQTMGRIEGVVAIVQDHIRITLNTKIFKKQLFDGIEFPNIGYGDDMFVYLLYHRASQSVYINSGYYFYFQRAGSICRTMNNIPVELKKISDWSDVLYDCYHFVEQHPEYHSALQIAGDYVKCVNMRLLRCMVVYPQKFTSKYFRRKAEELLSIPFYKGEILPRSIKIELILLKISPILFKIYRKSYNRLIQVTNRLKITNRRTCTLINENGFYWNKL